MTRLTFYFPSVPTTLLSWLASGSPRSKMIDDASISSSSGMSQLELEQTDGVAWQRRVRARWAKQLVPTSPFTKKHSINRRVRAESVTDFSFFHETLVPVAKKILIKTGFTGDQFSSEWCHVWTTITPFTQVIIVTKLSQKRCLVSL